MTAHIDPQTAVAMLDRRRQQNRIAQKNRRKRRAEQESSRSQQSSIDQERKDQQVPYEQGNSPRAELTRPESTSRANSVEVLSVPCFSVENKFDSFGDVALQAEPLWNQSDTVSDLLSAWTMPVIYPTDLEAATQTHGPAYATGSHSTLEHELTAVASVTNIGWHGLTTPPDCAELSHHCATSGVAGVPRSRQTSQHENGGKTALHIGAERGHVDIVEYLLDQGADVHIVDDSGRTALHYASSSGHARIVAKLLQSGADPEVWDYAGRSPLHTAADMGNVSVIRLLTQAGVDLNAAIGASTVGSDCTNAEVGRAIDESEQA